MLSRRLAFFGVCWLLVHAAAADPPLSLAALPFGNLSEYRGRLLEERAAAAMAAAAPGPWQALDGAAVHQAVEDLHAAWPLETADVQRLCDRLQAAVAVTGGIKAVQVQSQGAQVSLVLELVEPLSGETIGRASGLGKFSTRDALPVDARVDQALQRAAQAAWAALGPPPSLVGQVAGAAAAGAAADGRITINLTGKARLSPRAVLLIFAPAGAPAGPPLASAMVEQVAAGTAQARILARRGETLAGGLALLIGRLP